MLNRGLREQSVAFDASLVGTEETERYRVPRSHTFLWDLKGFSERAKSAEYPDGSLEWEGPAESQEEEGVWENLGQGFSIFQLTPYTSQSIQSNWNSPGASDLDWVDSCKLAAFSVHLVLRGINQTLGLSPVISSTVALCSWMTPCLH